ncbi:MAG: SDR family NAD(P)-dependent oxidoreductase [Sphingomonadales bacterium]|nr:SDR family NAD(P)-dependent oxidoreductase [Sphingomonadales bacterium]
MDGFENKVAFITGGASGIGFGIAQALSAAGARIVIADINDEAAAAAARRIGEAGGEAMAVRLDVADPAAWESARASATERFGNVHVLCNNAGVTGSMRTPADELTPQGWNWTRSVILDGVINGVIAFLPHIKGHGEGGHVVNTGSMASLIALAGTGDYTAAKFGVAGISEILRTELAGSDVGVSILCPGHTRTALIANSRGQMPDKLAAKVDGLMGSAAMTAAMETGLDPWIVGEMVRRAIVENRFYIFSHPEYREQVAARFGGILDDMDWAANCRGAIGQEMAG